MAGNLQDAISAVVQKTRADGGVLRVADAAVRLGRIEGGRRVGDGLLPGHAR
jgi:hypothetical protein